MPDVTDTQRLRVNQLTNTVNELYKLIVTGDTASGQPSLLENIRVMARDIREIKISRENIKELEERIDAIEERHRIIDKQKDRIDQQRKKWDGYKLAVFGTLFANIVMIVLQALGVI